MKTYKSLRGSGFLYILGSTILFNILIIGSLFFIDSYLLLTLLEVLFVLCNAYQIKYMLISLTTKYIVSKDAIEINAGFGLKKVVIPISSIEKYMKTEGVIRGVKLSGYGSHNYALGKFVISKIGTTSMFATSNKAILYLDTTDMNYGISPENTEEFERVLAEKGIEKSEWEKKASKASNLYKDKNFMIPFMLNSIVIFILVLNPFILYLKGSLPSKMPLSFDSNFIPLEYGPGKKFAIAQSVYGVLNMAILFCMYYASHFYSKYDKRSAYKFVYISLIISVVFLAMQFRILMKW